MQTRVESIPGFSKMAGGGNDFVVIDNRNGVIADAPSLARKICTRRLSVGADGIILIENSPRATFRMIYLNSDGSRAFCANGTRCAARFAFLNVIAGRRMTIETDAGVVGAEMLEKQVVLSLPPPKDFQADLRLKAGGSEVTGSRVVIGSPHFVAFLTEDLWSPDIEPVGREIRNHPALAPDGANVNFVRVRDRSSIEVRTYERGVEAETLSCGSGVVASAVVSALFGRVDSPVNVLTRSGITLQVAFVRKGGEVENLRLTGDARLIYKAEVTPDTVEGFDPDWVRHPTERQAEP